MKKEEWDQLSPQRKDVFTRIIKSQLSIELKAILESDVTSCGTGRRLGWCARSLKLFSSVLECAIDSYFYTPQSRAAAADCPSALWSSLSAVLIDNISSTDFTNVECGSPSVSSQYGIADFATGFFNVGMVRWGEDGDLGWFEGVGGGEIKLEGEVGGFGGGRRC